jgi:hypothetical protein
MRLQDIIYVDSYCRDARFDEDVNVVKEKKKEKEEEKNT